MIDCYAIIQKWTDQSISADLYRKLIGSDTVTTKEMISDYLYMTKMGMKTQYYTNVYTANSNATNTDDNEVCESCTL
jgi:ribonucleoside-diphosphate reductase alpha chain